MAYRICINLNIHNSLHIYSKPSRRPQAWPKPIRYCFQTNSVDCRVLCLRTICFSCTHLCGFLCLLVITPILTTTITHWRPLCMFYFSCLLTYHTLAILRHALPTIRGTARRGYLICIKLNIHNSLHIYS